MSSKDHNQQQKQYPINPGQKRQILTIFWEGTANTIDPVTTQIGLFANAVCAYRVASPDDVHDARDCRRPLKLAFDGCGVTNGQFWGVLFAAGLDGQVNTAISVIQKMLYQQQQQDQEVRGVHVVAVGLSRGGMACMKFARKLAQTFPAPPPQNDEAIVPLATAVGKM